MMTGAAGLEETVGLRLTAVTTKLCSLPSFPLFVGYLIFTSSARPIWKVAGPVDLKIPLILHNLTCFVASVYTFVAGVYALTTTPSLLTVSEGNSNVIHVLYVYWISKVIKLLDTVFIIFEHKKRQLTALHVFHHSSMLLLADFAYSRTRWTPISVGNQSGQVLMVGGTPVTLLFFFSALDVSPGHPIVPLL